MSNDLEEERKRLIDECVQRRAQLEKDLQRLQTEFNRTRDDPSPSIRSCAEWNLEWVKDQLAQMQKQERTLKSDLPKVPVGLPEYWVKFSIGAEFDELVLWYRGDVVTGVYCTDSKYLTAAFGAAERVGLRMSARWWTELWAIQRSAGEARGIVGSNRWQNGPKSGCSTQNW